MFNVSKLELPLELIAKSQTVLVNGVAPVYAYVDGKRSDNLQGYGYDCVLPCSGFQSIRIKVEETNPSITQEMIEEAGGTIEAEPLGFVGKLYVDSSGRVNLSSKAAKILIIK